MDNDQINQKFENATPQEILTWAIKIYSPKAILSSSFGAESAALIHMAIQIDPQIPVVLLNTGFLFKETLQFADDLKKRFNLNLRSYGPTDAEKAVVQKKLNSPDNKKGECCEDLKVRLMQASLTDVNCWVAGLRRNQAVTRKNIKIVEAYDTGMVKVHPIANWTSKEIYDYMKKFDLPFHPLWSRGYKSIGCEPCTSLPLPGQDDRSGRWAGTDKTECGINTFMKGQK